MVWHPSKAIITKMAKKSLVFSALCALSGIHNSSSFSINKAKHLLVRDKPDFLRTSQSLSPIEVYNCHQQATAPRPLARASVAILPFLYPSIASAVADFADDVELAELPPVYVPILFAIAVLGGVGVLTASLGDVMDEGK